MPAVSWAVCLRVQALDDLERYLDEMVFKLYGDSDAHPNMEDVASLTQEIFKGDFLSALIRAVPRLKESVRSPSALSSSLS